MHSADPYSTCSQLHMPRAGFRLIGIGLGVWTLAVAGSGAAVGFWSLVFCRMFVGVGEASFVSLASPFIGADCSHLQNLCLLR